MIGIIHHNDLDGFCSAAIVSLYEKDSEQEFFCSHYTTPILELTKDKKYEKIYVVDISFDLEIMEELKNKCENLIWIDHHKSSMEKLKDFEVNGKREIGNAACKLCWEYLFPNKKVPYGVKLINKFDIFDKSNIELWNKYIYPFKLGMGCYETQPNNNMETWNKIFENDEKFLRDTIDKGKVINNFLNVQFKEIAEKSSFEIQFEGKKAIVLNTPFVGSFSIESVYDSTKHDMMIIFRYSKDRYDISVYTDKTDIDVSKIAEKYGGGGHRQSAGFSCKQLPFKLSD